MRWSVSTLERWNVGTFEPSNVPTYLCYNLWNHKSHCEPQIFPSQEAHYMIFDRRTRRLARLWLALIMLVLSLGTTRMVGAQTSPPSQPAPPAPQAQPAPAPADLLSYVGDILPQRQRDLFVMRRDGTDKKQITHGFNVWFASWSPDGKKLAVTTEQSQIYTLNPDGSDLKLITSGAYSPPFWSPDGHFIAYVGGEKFATPVARGNLRIVPSTGGTPWLVPGGQDIPSLPPGAAA